MQKKFLVTLTTISTAFTMILAPGTTAMATDSASEDATTTVVATAGATVNVGNITITDGSSAVDASDNSTVTVNGDIVASGYNSSYSDNTGDVHYTASPAVNANSNSNVTVNGNISAGTDAAEQTAINSHQSTVTVNGNGTTEPAVSGTQSGIFSVSSDIDVTGNIVGSDTGITAHDDTDDDTLGNNIIVDGNVTAHGIQADIYDNDGNIIGTTQVATGVYSYGENNIAVTGDVYSPSNGLEVNIGNSGYTNDGNIVIEGTVVAPSGIKVHDNSKESNFSDAEDVISSTPNIAVYEIDSKIPVMTNFHSLEDSSENAKAYDQIVNAINYIIKKDSESVTNYGLTVSGDNITKINNLDTVNINEAFTVAANLPDGYTISGGDNISVTNNSDGTFTLTLTNSKGGIYVTAKLIPVTNPDGSTSYVVETESSDSSENERSYNDPAQAPAGAIVAVTNSGAADVPATIAAISGSKPAKTISYNMGNITPQQYKNSIISNVASVPANGAFNIETDRVACLDAGIIKALSTRSDIDVNVVFTYAGKKVKVTIPAGYDLNSLLDEKGYCGFLRLMSILGASEL